MAKNRKSEIEQMRDMKYVSEKLSISRSKINRLIENGDLQNIIKIGTKRLVSDTDLNNFLNNQKIKSGML